MSIYLRRNEPETSIETYSNDVPMEDTNPENEEDPLEFTVAIDFGTTFSLVSFIALDKSEKDRRIEPELVESIDRFPDAPGGSYEDRKEVPTESWYPKIALRKDTVDFDPFHIDLDSDKDTTDDEEAELEGYADQPMQGVTNHLDVYPDSVGEEANEEEPGKYFWGYGVQKQLEFPDTDRDQSRRIRRSKLMLDTSSRTQEIRDELQETLKGLKDRGLIKQDADVIADFLEQLFKHTKDRLETSFGFHAGCPVEFVLCVPAIWTRKACRIMQTAMAVAISRSGFGILNSGSVNNLFIVSEPEAAAAMVLAGPNALLQHDTFVLLDAGGGTVDAITYTVDNSYPLRLKTETVTPGGALCGSSYLNEEFEKHLLKRLKNEKYLEVNNMTIKGIVDQLVLAFENTGKRSVDVTSGALQGTVIFIQGLKRSVRKRFKENRLLLSRDDQVRIFRKCLKETARVMTEQILLATEKGLIVKKVILIGGFAGSPSLIKWLERELVELAQRQGRRAIPLLCPNVPGTAVAVGAVLRALRKEEGPARIIQSSYGFLQTEPHEPDLYNAHKEQKPSWDKLDGQWYIKYAINWLINKGDELPPRKEYCIPVFHTFPALANQQFLVGEALYVSDEYQESHYRLRHPKNQGRAAKEGVITADMTFLRTEGHIQPTIPGPGERGKKHYKVEFDLVMIVDGRNLRYEARWPMGNGQGQVQGKGQTSIAAAFVPGTQ